MSEERYIHAGTQVDVEFNRLTQLTSIFDPVTIRHLVTIGVADGWKCLDVGAGTGSIAQWLSARVGPTGKVVATDIDMRFLNRINAPNLEIRRHDILKDDLEKGEYDLVHCRKLLEHLSEPEKALRQMADAVRPGGWLLIEEDDYGSMLSLDVTESSTNVLAWEKTIRAAQDFLRKRGIVDGYFGRRVRSLVEGLGFVEVGNEGWTRMTRGGELNAQLVRWDAQLIAKIMVDAGMITREEADNVCRPFLDPAFYYLDYTFFSAWGRKPVQGGGT